MKEYTIDYNLLSNIKEIIGSEYESLKDFYYNVLANDEASFKILDSYMEYFLCSLFKSIFNTFPEEIPSKYSSINVPGFDDNIYLYDDYLKSKNSINEENTNIERILYISNIVYDNDDFNKKRNSLKEIDCEKRITAWCFYSPYEADILNDHFGHIDYRSLAVCRNFNHKLLKLYKKVNGYIDTYDHKDLIKECNKDEINSKIFNGGIFEVAGTKEVKCFFRCIQNKSGNLCILPYSFFVEDCSIDLLKSATLKLFDEVNGSSKKVFLDMANKYFQESIIKYTSYEPVNFKGIYESNQELQDECDKIILALLKNDNYKMFDLKSLEASNFSLYYKAIISLASKGLIDFKYNGSCILEVKPNLETHRYFFDKYPEFIEEYLYYEYISKEHILEKSNEFRYDFETFLSYVHNSGEIINHGLYYEEEKEGINNYSFPRIRRIF